MGPDFTLTANCVVIPSKSRCEVSDSICRTIESIGYRTNVRQLWRHFLLIPTHLTLPIDFEL